MTGEPEPPGTRPSFVRSAVATYATQLGMGFVSLLNVLVVARYLGASGRGNVAFLVAVSYLSSQLATLGVQMSIGNLAASRPESRGALATNACMFALVFGALADLILATGIAIVPDIGGDEGWRLLLLAFAIIPGLILGQYLVLLLQADYRFGAANASWLTPPVVNITLNGLLSVTNQLTPGRAFSTWVLGQVLSLGILVVATQRSSGFGRPDLALANESLRFGLKSHFGRIMLLGNYRFDQWIMGAISNARELGIYSVAVAWAEVLFFLPTVLSAVLRPDVARADRRGAGAATAAVFRVAILLTVPLAVILILAAPFLCVTLLGSEFSDSVPEMRVLTLGAFGIVGLKILGSSLTAQGRPYLETAAIGGAFLMTLVLDVVLIPAHGGMGASIASTVAYTTGGIAVVLIFSRALGVSVRQLVPRVGDSRRVADALARRGAYSRQEG